MIYGQGRKTTRFFDLWIIPKNYRIYVRKEMEESEMGRSIEKILEDADFSKESTLKNQLFYELFHKPVPVTSESVGITMLDFESLGSVAGGVTRNLPYNEFREKASVLASQMSEEQLNRCFEEYLAKGASVPIEEFIREFGKRIV